MKYNMDNKFSLWAGILGSIVTICASIGGSYITTRVTLAVHSQQIEELKRHDIEVDKKLELLYKIDKAVAVIEERTKNK